MKRMKLTIRAIVLEYIYLECLGSNLTITKRLEYVLSFNFHQRNLEVLSSMLSANFILFPSWLHLKQMFLIKTHQTL